VPLAPAPRGVGAYAPFIRGSLKKRTRSRSAQKGPKRGGSAKSAALRRRAMKSIKYAYISGALVAAIAFAIVGGKSLADGSGNKTRTPVFAVDPFWPKPLPAPVGTDGIAHPWIQGEVAGNCIDPRDNVYTFNR